MYDSMHHELAVLRENAAESEKVSERANAIGLVGVKLSGFVIDALCVEERAIARATLIRICVVGVEAAIENHDANACMNRVAAANSCGFCFDCDCGSLVHLSDGEAVIERNCDFSNICVDAAVSESVSENDAIDNDVTAIGCGFVSATRKDFDRDLDAAGSHFDRV